MGHWRCTVGLAVVALLLGAACSEGTRVVVHVDGEGAATAGVVNVVARVGAVGEAPRVERYAIGPDGSGLPLRLLLEPLGGDASRRYEVILELTDAAGAVIGEQRALSGYVSGEARELRLLFDDPCVGMRCGDGFSCFEGTCVEACVEPTPAGAVTRSVFIACSPPEDAGATDSATDVGAMDAAVDAPSCDAGTAPSCIDGDMQICEGGTLRIDECDLPCESGDVACPTVLPSNIGDMVDLGASSRALTVPSGQYWIFDTTDLSIRAFDGDPTGAELTPDLDGVVFRVVVPDPATPDYSLGVMAVESLHVEAGATLWGTGPRPMVVLAASDVSVDGVLTVASRYEDVGAGGHAGGAAAGGEGPGAGAIGRYPSPDFIFGGGGGGGFATEGGRGGRGQNSGISADPGAGGGTYGSARLVPLVGGSGGGSGGGGTLRSQPGGPGGGAIQVTAGRSIVVTSTGTVDASGSGGIQNPTSTGGGGGGGGSGGSLLLEAPNITIDGAVGSNGGGGSAGGGPCPDAKGVAVRGPAGVNGDASVAPAAGGVPFSCNGRGGYGNGPGGNPPTGDAMDMTGQNNRDGGGGGGGAGRVRINTAAGVPAAQFPTVLPNEDSGAFTTGAVTRAP